MTEDPLVRARKRAERAVDGMEDGPLKVAAFQAILGKLLNALDSDDGGRPIPVKASSHAGKQPDTLNGRILAIRGEGFFKMQRSLSEVREALGSRGWHYPLTTLSGAMQALVRKRQLRRERVNAGKKKVWKYADQ